MLYNIRKDFSLVNIEYIFVAIEYYCFDDYSNFLVLVE